MAAWSSATNSESTAAHTQKHANIHTYTQNVRKFSKSISFQNQRPLESHQSQRGPALHIRCNRLCIAAPYWNTPPHTAPHAAWVQHHELIKHGRFRQTFSLQLKFTAQSCYRELTFEEINATSGMCIYICMYTCYISIYIYVYMVHIYVYVYMLYIYIYICIYVYTHVYVFINIHICVHICICTNVCWHMYR